MRRMLIIVLLCHFVTQHYCRNVATAQKGVAPQSDLGTDVIEISNSRDNGLPPYIEEEPSEQDILDDTQDEGDSKPADTTTAYPETESPAEKKKLAESDKGDDEASLAKKLDAFYKDTDDKKETGKPEISVTQEESPTEDSARRTFQPDLNNKLLVEKYRTAQDSISCRTASPLSGDSSSRASIVELGWSMIVTTVLLAISRRDSCA